MSYCNTGAMQATWPGTPRVWPRRLAIQGVGMIGKRAWRGQMRRTSAAGQDAVKSVQPERVRSPAPRPAGVTPSGVVALLAAALFLQCAEARADLMFRSAQQVNGQTRWSEFKSYGKPSDIAYLRAPADGTQQAAAEDVQVQLQGNITSADVYGARVMASLLKQGKQRIAGNTVWFDSSGGEIDAAMELGRELRKLGVTAFVGEGDQCLSSCVFAFMGGDRRTVAGRLGIHRPYFSSARETPDRRSEYRRLQKRLREYIEELDFPPSLYEAVMAVPPLSLNILTSAELKKYYLEGMSPSAEDEAYAANARSLGISVGEYLQQKAPAQPCAGAPAGRGPCAGAARTTAGGGAVAAEPAQPVDAGSANRAVGRAAKAEK